MPSTRCFKRVKLPPPSEAEVASTDLMFNFTNPDDAMDAIVDSDLQALEVAAEDEGEEDPEASPEADEGRCQGCDWAEYDYVERFYKKEEEAERFFVNHGIYPSRKTVAVCQKCDSPIRFDPDLTPFPGWSCKKIQRMIKVKLPKQKRNKRKMDRCPTYMNAINRRTGAFMGKSKIPTWKLLMKALLWCQRDNRHVRTLSNLKVSLGTSSKYRKCF